MRTQFIKCTGPNGTSIHNFLHFPLPTVDLPGDWTIPCAADRPLRPHFWGYHITYPYFISDWFGEENYWAEANGEIVKGHGCYVARSIRLSERIQSSDRHWHDIAVCLTLPIVGLIRHMDFPQQFVSVIEPAYNKIIKWLAGDDRVTSDARDLVAQTIVLAGRNSTDGYASYEWMANSDTAMYSAMAVATLGFLKRQDGPRLVDVPITKAQQRVLAKPYINPLYDRGVGMMGIPESNFRVAKNICGFTAKAAEASTRQMMWTTIKRDGLSALHKQWIDNARIHPEAPRNFLALSGIRAMQSEMICQTLKINM
jgi:hypothetical protein